jgi:hypothetical protein
MASVQIDAENFFGKLTAFRQYWDEVSRFTSGWRF